VGDVGALADALARYVQDDSLRAIHGRAARARVEDRFSLRAMVAAYGALYDGLCRNKAH
jgi:glycosyltransferase involved in cell wall biosynthesis